MNRILLSLLIISIAFIGISTVAAADVEHSGMDRPSCDQPVCCSGHIDYEHHIYVFDDDDDPGIGPRQPGPLHPVVPYSPTNPPYNPVQ